MGVNVLWISSPVANTENPGKGMGGDTRYYAPYLSYWPVATGWTNELRLPGLDSPIEKHFGSEEKLHELIQKAHKKGIRVMFDFVPNHVHTDSYLWKTYKNRGWFNMAENGLPANSNGGYSCGWERPVYCWFTDYLADIDYRNDEAMDAVAEAAWANGTGARGLRGIMETVLTDFMFEAADSKNKRMTVNRACVEKALGLFANLRPAMLLPELAGACLLRADIASRGLDLIVVRELTGDIYFGEPGL